MIHKILTIFICAGVFNAPAFAASPLMIKDAQCLGDQGAQLRVNVRASQIEGQIGNLKKMNNRGLSEAFGVQQDFPAEGWVALGGLVKDQAGYWGNLSVVVEANRDLGSQEVLKVYFVDMGGKSHTEDVTCDLQF